MKRQFRKSLKKLLNFRKIFFREKYRFDHGNGFLVFVNFALLVSNMVSLSGGNKEYIKYYVMIGLFVTWLLGYVLDKFVKIQDIQEKVALKRSPIWQENFKNHNHHNQMLEDLLGQLDRIEHKVSLCKK